jgi:hypothetical protein
MGDLKNPTVIWIKGVLFLIVGLFASTLLVLHAPSLTVALLLCVSVWAFCRAYYFAFYVIEHYLDANYRYSGLLSFLQYVMRIRRPTRQDVVSKSKADG